MHMLFVRNILIIKPIDINFLLAMPRTQQFDKITLELGRVLIDDFAGVFADDTHVPHV
jgi:hypothetical protein